MGQLYSFLFTIGKAGHAFAFHQWSPLLGHAVKHSTGMANSRDRLAGIVERLDQCNGVGVVGKIPHGAMTAHVENGVEIFRSHIRKFDSL